MENGVGFQEKGWPPNQFFLIQIAFWPPWDIMGLRDGLWGPLVNLLHSLGVSGVPPWGHLGVPSRNTARPRLARSLLTAPLETLQKLLYY